MSSSLLLAIKSWNNGVTPGAAEKYDNDSGIWTNITSDPAMTADGNSTLTCKGGWDGNRWYIISSSGGLHAYTPTTDTWTTNLVSGSNIITGNLRWCMASDGSYIYILNDGNGFRRYDPSLDVLTALMSPPGTAFGNALFLTYDGSGSIYGSKGDDDPAVISKYDIVSNTWTQLPSGGWSTGTSRMGNGLGNWSAFLSGALWLVYADGTSATLRAFRYDPVGNTWTTKATQATDTSYNYASPGGEDSDSSIRVWSQNSGAASYVYNIALDSWSSSTVSPNAFVQGTNCAVTRLFSASFVWYQSDGVTTLPITVDLGTGVLSQTLTYHAKVKTPVGRAAGVTVSVPDNITTDAEDVVTICQTSGGTFGKSFSTGALNPGDEFDVFISLTISASQTLGLAKRFFLEISSN